MFINSINKCSTYFRKLENCIPEDCLTAWKTEKYTSDAVILSIYILCMSCTNVNVNIYIFMISYIDLAIYIYVYIWTRNQCVDVLRRDKKTKQKTQKVCLTKSIYILYVYPHAECMLNAAGSLRGHRDTFCPSGSRGLWISVKKRERIAFCYLN